MDFRRAAGRPSSRGSRPRPRRPPGRPTHTTPCRKQVGQLPGVQGPQAGEGGGQAEAGRRGQVRQVREHVPGGAQRGGAAASHK